MTPDRVEGYKNIVVGANRHIASNSKAPLFVLEEYDRLSSSNFGDALLLPTAKGSGILSIGYLFELFKDFDFVTGLVSFYNDKLQDEIKERKIQLGKLKLDILSWPDDQRKKDMEEYVRNEESLDSSFDKMKNYRMQCDIEFVFMSIFYTILVKELGIKNVVLGGMFYDDKDATGPGGCAGQVADTLKSIGVKVKMSRYHMDFDGHDIYGDVVARSSKPPSGEGE